MIKKVNWAFIEKRNCKLQTKIYYPLLLSIELQISCFAFVAYHLCVHRLYKRGEREGRLQKNEQATRQAT